VWSIGIIYPILLFLYITEQCVITAQGSLVLLSGGEDRFKLKRSKNPPEDFRKNLGKNLRNYFEKS
jgi:hypothetical protein